MTSVCQGLSSLASGGGKMRDPGNEVDAGADHDETLVAKIIFKILQYHEIEREEGPKKTKNLQPYF